MDGDAGAASGAAAAGPARPATSIVFHMNEDAAASASRSESDGLLERDVIRPSTGRPGTGKRPGTAASAAAPAAAGFAAAQSHIVVLAENRAREVGVAVVNLAAMHLIDLYQIADNQSYTQTLALLALIGPAEIVLSKSQVERPLAQRIVETWAAGEGIHSAQVSAIARKWYDEAQGDARCKALSVKTATNVSGKYMALASLAALLKYVEHMQHVVFADHTVLFDFKETKGRMALDYETIRVLELLANARTGSARDSLFGVVNRTQTAVGTRLLRAQLVSPVNDLFTLNTRFDAVEDLLAHAPAYSGLRTLLCKALDLDALLSQFTATPKTMTPRTARAAIHAIIALKHCLNLCPRIAAAMADLENPLIAAISKNLQHETLGTLGTLIDEYVTEETAWTKSAVAQRQQECFAVRPGVDGTLDAVRKIYLDCMEEISTLSDAYRAEWEQPALKLTHNTTRGYHLQLPINATIPAAAVQPVAMKTVVAFSTEELVSLNERLKESLLNIYVLTSGVVQALVTSIRGQMRPLIKVTESIALLDMLLSHANLVVTNPGRYVRPSFSEHGPFIIVQGRHPLVEHACGAAQRTFVPNDLFLGPGANMMLLTGPNCSGKSTYLKQLAVLTVMAHIGCFVPAEHASFRLTDRICTRIGTSDDMEANASTFLKEMKETAYIIDAVGACAGTGGATGAGGAAVATGALASRAAAPSAPSKGPRVLVIIDELGRGTSTEDGVGIAWSVCEHLLKTNAYTVCVTHFHELQDLTSLYSNVRASSMTVEASADLASLSFKYAVVDGASPLKSDYGIKLAEMCGLPWDVVREARTIKNDLVTRIAPGSSIVTGATLVSSGAAGGAAAVGTGSASAAAGSSIAVTPSRRGGTGGGVAAASASAAGGGDTGGPSPFELHPSSSTADALLHAKRFKMMTEAAAQLSALTLSPMHEMDIGAVRSLVQGVRDAFATTFLDVGVTASSLTTALELRTTSGAARLVDHSASRTLQASGAGRPMTAASWTSSGTGGAAGGGGGRIRVSGGVLETSLALSQSQADVSHVMAADASAAAAALDDAHLRAMDGDISMMGMPTRALSPCGSAPDTTLPLRGLPDHDAPGGDAASDPLAGGQAAADASNDVSPTGSNALASAAHADADGVPLLAGLPGDATLGGRTVDAMGFE